jgi:hypothetical protein
MVVLPNGDLLIITKETNEMETEVRASEVFRLPAAGLKIKDQRKQKLEYLGNLPLPEWRPKSSTKENEVTDAAINEKRNVLGLLTYGNVLEIPLEKLKTLKTSRDWKEHQEYDFVPIKVLAQQESLTYATDGSLLWSSEASIGPTPVYSMKCTSTK